MSAAATLVTSSVEGAGAGPRGERAEERFATVYRRVHASHPACLADDWLGNPCSDERGRPCERPFVWSRRNGPWRQVETLWIGAAPGNAGGRGAGELGAHGTRIPFGGDVAGANLDVLFGSIGITRNDTFIAAALNHLPAAGGGEPTLTELMEPVGLYPTSLHLLRDTILAAAPQLLIALGNVALRATFAAAGMEQPVRLPGLARLRTAGVQRGRAVPWPRSEPPSDPFLDLWRDAAGEQPLPHLLWLMHPSAQNMNPYAGVNTSFHARMLDARDHLRAAVTEVLGRPVPPERAAEWPEEGVYALPEWTDAVGPRHADLDRLWREKGV